MSRQTLRWTPGDLPPAFTGTDLAAMCDAIREPRYVIRSDDGRLGLGPRGGVSPAGGSYDVVSVLPALYPEWLGGRAFTTAHDLRFPYVAGEMAKGIATPTMVVRMAEAGMLGVFGAGGLEAGTAREAIHTIAGRLGRGRSWGVNLLHSPDEPHLEEQLVDAVLAEHVPVVSASAFVTPTPALVRAAVSGLHAGGNGPVRRARRIIAKLSRPEVAEKFMQPAAAEVLRVLRDGGDITEREAQLAQTVPLAEDITVEADSGGHTDNRPLSVALPAVLAARDRAQQRFGDAVRIRVGAAGGIGTPEAVAAAFALGAAYVVTGSVNQAAVESGLSDDAKAMLAAAEASDVAMAPSADMFELGAKVQVLRRGTLFAGRAAQLHEVYSRHRSLADIPADVIGRLERDVFGMPIEEVWADTRRFWAERDPSQVDRARTDAHHHLALVLRWYLGNSSTWAMRGTPRRRTDYQIWCGPAMGAFNAWTAGTFLADPAERSVVQIALNLLEGAAMLTRRYQVALCGITVPGGAIVPRRLSV